MPVFYFYFLTYIEGAGKMHLRIKMLAAKPDDLSSIITMVRWKKRTNSSRLSSDFYLNVMELVSIYMK